MKEGVYNKYIKPPTLRNYVSNFLTNKNLLSSGIMMDSTCAKPGYSESEGASRHTISPGVNVCPSIVTDVALYEKKWDIRAH